MELYSIVSCGCMTVLPRLTKAKRPRPANWLEFRFPKNRQPIVVVWRLSDLLLTLAVADFLVAQAASVWRKLRYLFGVLAGRSAGPDAQAFCSKAGLSFPL